jgi:hypothetical protein
LRLDYLAYTSAEIDYYAALNKQVFGFTKFGPMWGYRWAKEPKWISEYGKADAKQTP